MDSELLQLAQQLVISAAPRGHLSMQDTLRTCLLSPAELEHIWKYMAMVIKRPSTGAELLSSMKLPPGVYRVFRMDLFAGVGFVDDIAAHLRSGSYQPVQEESIVRAAAAGGQVEVLKLFAPFHLRSFYDVVTTATRYRQPVVLERLPELVGPDGLLERKELKEAVAFIGRHQGQPAVAFALEHSALLREAMQE